MEHSPPCPAWLTAPPQMLARPPSLRRGDLVAPLKPHESTLFPSMEGSRRPGLCPQCLLNLNRPLRDPVSSLSEDILDSFHPGGAQGAFVTLHQPLTAWCFRDPRLHLPSCFNDNHYGLCTWSTSCARLELL